MTQNRFSIGRAAKLLAGFCVLGLSSASASMFNVIGVLADGSEMVGQITINTIGSINTAVISASITIGPPSTVTCSGVSGSQGANGAAGYNFGVSCTSNFLVLTLLTPLSASGYLNGYTGGGVNTFPGDSGLQATGVLVTSGAVTPAEQIQSVTFTTPPPASAAYNSSFTVAAMASSGLPVTFNSSGSCTNSGATYTMTSATGTCTVTAFQAGNSNFASAEVTQNVSATPASQTITFTTPPPASAVYGTSFTVAATGGASGNPVTFTSSGSCTNSTATYTMTSATGTCTVIANQAGNTNYAAATATYSVSATKAVLTVTATSFTQPYRTPIPTLTYSFSGFVSPDTASVVTGAPVLTTTATQSSLPGAYPITIAQGTLAAANYTFSLLPGTLTITLPVGLGLCVPFPVSLAAPAGPTGAALTLTSSNPSIVDFSPGVNPIVVIIPAGATSPQRGEIPQVCGVNFGTATVSATPGAATASQTVEVEVTATLSFAYASSTTSAGRQDRLELDLSVPAPAGGLTVNLSSSNTAVATVPATIVIPANSTSVIVSVDAVATGSTLISADALPNVPVTTTSITVH